MYAITIKLSLGLAYLEGSKGLFKYQEVRGRAQLHGREALHVRGSVCICVLFAPVSVINFPRRRILITNVMIRRSDIFTTV